MSSLGQPSDQLRVFVIGMRGDDEHATGDAEALNERAEARGAAVLSDERQRSNGEQKRHGAE